MSSKRKEALKKFNFLGRLNIFDLRKKFLMSDTNGTSTL